MRYFIRKFSSLVITMVLVSLITFLVFQILPGNPAETILGVDADKYQIEALNNKMGLNKPPFYRYISWASNAIRGNLGDSIKYQELVSKLIGSRIEVTVSLAVISLIITFFIGIPLGIFLARANNKKISIFVSMLSQLGIAIPSFWMGIMLIMFFSVFFKIFPSGGYTSWGENPLLAIKSLILPSISIAIGTSAVVVRYLKNVLLDELKLDYVRTAFSKGLKEKRILTAHVLRNVLIPVVTIIGMIATDILGGSIITENVFSLPGLGNLIVISINSRDLPLIQGLVLYLAFIVVLINFAVDMLYIIIDPRISLK